MRISGEVTPLALDGSNLKGTSPALLSLGAGEFAKESYLSEHMPYLTYVDDQIMMLKQGDLMMRSL